MLLHIPGILDKSVLNTIIRILGNAQFIDGKLTAGGIARQIKNNMEVSANDNAVQKLNHIIRAQLEKSPMYMHAVLPNKTGTPIYAQYTSGMSYGKHIDAPFMGSTVRYRSDVSITIFLSEPESYKGGELVIDTPFGGQKVKLPAGDAVVYPSSSLHRVTEVTEGTRTVAITWIESLIKDPIKRQLLYEFYDSKEQLTQACNNPEKINRLTNVYVNLLRMWSET